MKPSARVYRSIFWTVGFGVLAAVAQAHAGDPIIAPGQWSYQADIHYHSGMMRGGALHKTWSSCVKPGDTRIPKVMPSAPGVRCDKPTLTVAGKTLNTAMRCTSTAANGFVSKIVENFAITPSADKRKIVMDGTVHQSFTGGPVALPAAVMRVHTTGVRTGRCSAAK